MFSICLSNLNGIATKTNELWAKEETISNYCRVSSSLPHSVQIACCFFFYFLLVFFFGFDRVENIFVAAAPAPTPPSPFGYFMSVLRARTIFALRVLVCGLCVMWHWLPLQLLLLLLQLLLLLLLLLATGRGQERVYEHRQLADLSALKIEFNLFKRCAALILQRCNVLRQGNFMMKMMMMILWSSSAARAPYRN